MTQTFSEPLLATLKRTITIALIVGSILFYVIPAIEKDLVHYLGVLLFVFCFSFGGHWPELWYRNHLAPALPQSQRGKSLVRIGFWYLVGLLLYALAAQVASVFGLAKIGDIPFLLGGFVFIAVELAVHLSMFLLGLANFYQGTD